MSMNPGATTSPVASTIVSPGCGSPAPTDTMRSPTIRTIPGRSGDPLPSAICAPTMADARSLFCASRRRNPDARPIASTQTARATDRRLLNDRLHDCVFKIAHQLTVGLLHHQQADELLLAVNPEVRAERAVPSEAAVRLAAICRDAVEHHFHREPEPHPFQPLPDTGIEIADMIRRHQVD